MNHDTLFGDRELLACFDVNSTPWIELLVISEAAGPMLFEKSTFVAAMREAVQRGHSVLNPQNSGYSGVLRIQSQGLHVRSESPDALVSVTRECYNPKGGVSFQLAIAS